MEDILIFCILRNFPTWSYVIYNIFFLFQGADYGLNANGARRMGSKRSPRGPILHIAKVRKEDAGTYTCTASNGVGTMSADQIELNVLCKYTMRVFYPILIIFQIWPIYGTKALGWLFIFQTLQRFQRQSELYIQDFVAKLTWLV